MSGFEIVGVVLAVLPLCITALEHYEDEVRPFKALLRYETHLKRSRMELLFLHCSFTKTIQNLCEDAAVATSEQFEEMVKDPSASTWRDDEAEKKLVQYLSRQGYDAYKFKAATVCGKLLEVAGILGLDEKGIFKTESMGGFRADVWKGVKSTQTKSQSAAAAKSSASTTTPNTYESLKNRVRFILKGGSLGPLVKKISEGTHELDRLIEKSCRPQVAPIRPTASRPKELFSRPLQDIEDQARRLHRTLHGVWQCPQHPSHCVNLRLEPRLKKLGSIDTDQASFTIALSPYPSWRSLEINIVDQQLNQQKQTVGFQLPNTGPTQMALSQMSVIDCLCQHASAHTICIPLYLNHDDKLLSENPTIIANPAASTTCNRVTLRDLLAASKRPGISAKQSMRLALTLVSSFLQLQSTPWLEDLWCAEDVILVQTNTKPDLERPFISQMYPPTSGVATTRLSDSDRVFALGTILLQIITQTPIEDRRTTSGASKEDPSIMRSSLHDDADDWLDCFAESIAACSMFYHGRFDMDLNDPPTRNEFIEAVLAPFQRDLKW